MGGGDDLFMDGAVETVGKPLVVDVARLLNALKGGDIETELKDGRVNGIDIQADVNDFKIDYLRKAIFLCAGMR